MNPPTPQSPHTPTPLPNWTVRELCGQVRICRDRAFGEEVLCIVKQAETSKETENRIQMILRACNSHAALVAALEQCTALCKLGRVHSFKLHVVEICEKTLAGAKEGHA
jgi:hypothetical protein